MAQKRMFDKDVISLDNFLDLPMDAKALYFLLGMEADDEGFVSPKRVVRLYGGTEDSIKILIMKGFLIPFNTGVVVITDWRRNNWLDKRRVKPTIYTDEKSSITFNELTEKYECLADAKQMLREYRREENSIEENSIVESSNTPKVNQRFKKPSIEEIKAYCEERHNDVNPNKFYEYYEVNNWKDKDGKQVKNWKQKIITWEGRNKKQDIELPNWYDKEIDNKPLSIEEQEEMDALLEDFK